MSPTIDNKSLHSCLSMSLRSHIKHSFHVFDHALKQSEEIKSHLRLDIHHFLMFSYHDQTLELVFHILRETMFTTCYACKLPKSHRFPLIGMTFMYENCDCFKFHDVTVT